MRTAHRTLVKAQANRLISPYYSGPRQTGFGFGGAEPWRMLFRVQAFLGFPVSG